MTMTDGAAVNFPGSGATTVDATGFAALTPRERAVLGGLVAGLRPADIARRDFVSVVTVRNQVQSILIKLNVHSQLEAVAAARWSDWNDLTPSAVGTPMAAFDASAS